MTQIEVEIPGESAVVTAGGSGIGRQIASHLTDAGIDVAINDIDVNALEEAEATLADNSGDVLSLQADASDPNEMAEVVETAADEYDGLDILVNNVGIAGPTKPCEEITNEEFMGTLSVNLGGLFNATNAAIPYLREGEAGRIVNISSMSGKRPLRDRTPYVTSKMGVIGFTRTLGEELAKDDVNVNAICPGSVAGPRLDDVIREQAENQDRSFEDVEQEFREVSPKKEFVEAGDVADMVLLLCSDRTDKMTGQDVNVTAGIVMY